MGNAEIQEEYYNRTFWQAVHGVIPIAATQTLAFMVIFLLALGLTWAVRIRVASMQLFMMALLMSFFVWPALYIAYLNVSQPAEFKMWFLGPKSSLLSIALVGLILNFPAI
jgi:hypothetical protein